MQNITVYNKAKTKTFQATVLAYHDGKTFVEHPTQGDEMPIMILQKDGTLKASHAWDIDSVYCGDY